MDKPFLKWAGGKAKITARINRNLHKLKQQSNATQLIEPFLGSGAVFLNANSVGFSQYLLCEINEDLIDLYQTLQLDTNGSFIDECESLFTEKNREQEEYIKRRKEFNDVKKELQNTSLKPEEKGQKKRTKSALFIYLNRHCFNGLCRYNNKGEFNVPFGQFKKIYFPRKEMENFHKKSKDTKKVIFKCMDFEEVLTYAVQDTTTKSVVYADPPYVPLEAQTSNFSKYAKGGFPVQKHEQLATMIKELAKKGTPVLLSNHHTDFTKELYEGENVSFETFEVRRSISSDGENRNKVEEMLVSFSVSAPIKK